MADNRIERLVNASEYSGLSEEREAGWRWFRLSRAFSIFIWRALAVITVIGSLSIALLYSWWLFNTITGQTDWFSRVMHLCILWGIYLIVNGNPENLIGWVFGFVRAIWMKRRNLFFKPIRQPKKKEEVYY